jgi:hypothetical protein
VQNLRLLRSSVSIAPGTLTARQQSLLHCQTVLESKDHITSRPRPAPHCGGMPAAGYNDLVADGLVRFDGADGRGSATAQRAPCTKIYQSMMNVRDWPDDYIHRQSEYAMYLGNPEIPGPSDATRSAALLFRCKNFFGSASVDCASRAMRPASRTASSGSSCHSHRATKQR